MKVRFQIHGMERIVEGVLDLEDTQVPAIGWELTFDSMELPVTGVQGHYSELGSARITLDLAVREGDYDPAWIVEFFRSNIGLTAFSEVELGGWCFCPLCPNGK